MKVRALLMTIAIASFTVLASTTATAQTTALRLTTAIVEPNASGTVRLRVDALASEPIGGVSFGLSLPAGFSAPSGFMSDADFVGTNDGPGFITVGLLFSVTGLELRGPGFVTIGSIELEHPAIAAGTAEEIPFAAGLGSPPAPIEFATPNGPIAPQTLSGGVLAASPPESLIWSFSPTTNQVWYVESDGLAASTSIAGAGSTVPRACVIDANGIAWTSYSGTNEIRRFNSDGNEIFVFGTSSRIESDAGPGAIAVDIFGNAWIANVGTSSVSQIDPFGRVIFGGNGRPVAAPQDGLFSPAIAFADPPRAIAADPFGSVWVVSTSAPFPAVGNATLTRLNRSGAKAVDIDLGLGNPISVAVDRTGFAWIPVPSRDEIQRRASDGSLAETVSLEAPRLVTLARGSGGLEVWAVGDDPSGTGLDRIHRIRTGLPVESYDSPFPTDLIEGITTDGAGRIWIAAGDFVHRLDFASPPPTAPIATSVLTGSNTQMVGDATGYGQALFFPDGDPDENFFFDFDGDGAVNTIEFEAGTDVFDVASFPSVPLLPVQGLQCASAGGTISLTWSNAASYTGVRVLANGVLQTVAAGSDESVQLSLPGPAVYTIEVIAEDGATTSPASTCQVIVGPGEVLDDTPIFAMSELVNPFDVATTDLQGPCVPFYLVTDPATRLVHVLDEFAVVMSSFSSDIFTGNFGASGVAFDSTGNGGAGSLFLVGGSDTEQTEIREVTLDGAPIPATAPILVSDALGPLVGEPGSLTLKNNPLGTDVLAFTGPDGCDIFALAKGGTGTIFQNASFAHPLLNSGFGLNGVEIVDDYGPNGGVIWITGTGSATPGVYEAIEVVVAAGFALPTGNSIQLFEIENENVLGGFGFVTNPNESTVELAVIGITTSSLYDVATTSAYVRGDSDGDGTMTIMDCFATFDALFGSGNAVNCLAALDGNDDGNVNLGDVLFTLQALFGMGPLPPPPFPDPGGSPFECVVP